MREPRAQRTLVKSPPELWAELSDPDALTRHLEGLGELRITRLDHETTVAWEGDRVRGTVELEASGWGTKVTLTAATEQPVLALGEEEPPPAAASAPVAAPPPETAVTGEPQAAPRRLGLLALLRRRPRVTAAPVLAPPERALADTDPGPPAPVVPLPVRPPAQPQPDLPPAAAALASADVERILSGALDALGSASKRPYSR